jgi:hypothetical protein
MDETMKEKRGLKEKTIEDRAIVEQDEITARVDAIISDESQE